MRGRPVLLVSLAVVVAAALVWGLAAGPVAGLSALGGGVGTVLLLASTPAVLGPVVGGAPRLSLLAALMFYLLKITVIATVLVALSSEAVRSGLDVPAIGWSVTLAVLVWTAAFVTATVRARTLVYDLDSETG